MSEVFAPPKTANLEPPPDETGDTQWAGFWRRAAAYLLDGLILFIPSVALAVAIGNELLGSLAQFILWGAYKVGLESGPKQATLGKRAMGVKVVGPTGERISAARAFGRLLGMIPAGLILGIGFLMAGLTRRKQGLHDMIASTYVVRAGDAASDVVAEHPTMPMTAGVWIAVILLFIFPFGLGILAAIAIPAYSDYTVRSYMMEAIYDGNRVKEDALQAFAASQPPRLVAPTSRHVKSIAIDPASRSIVVSLNGELFRAQGIDPAAQITLTLRPGSSESDWACSTRGISNKYLPVACRK
jgi:uncharacterized RDD family membrane protein YckC/Tfp pilus assembly major pilin PilA